jgi:hypothetical protein
LKLCDLSPEEAHGGVATTVVTAVDFLTPVPFVQKYFNGHEPNNPSAPPACGRVVQSGGPADSRRMAGNPDDSAANALDTGVSVSIPYELSSGSWSSGNERGAFCSDRVTSRRRSLSLRVR